MKLFDTKLSGNAWKVRLVLRHLRLQFDRVSLSLPAGDQKTAEFTSLNQFQRVPVLVMHDEVTLTESGAILIRLTEGTDLLPSDANLRGKVMAWMFFEQADLSRFLAYPRFFKMIGQAEAQAEVIAHYHDIAHTSLKRIEDALNGNEWITGAALTVADFALYPYIKLSPEGGLDLAGYPNINAWIARFESLAHFEPLVPEAEVAA
ncbi:MAG: glutathione S-transferase family protein [Cognatishimia sp.]